MSMFKSDDEIRRGWTNLERSFEGWYNNNQKAIAATLDLGSHWNAFNKLWSVSYRPEQRAAFDKWCDEWLDRDFKRMTRRVHPKEFIQTVMNTNFLDPNSITKLFWQMDSFKMPFISIGRSNFGKVPTYYGFTPTARFLQPDVETNRPDKTDSQILALSIPTPRLRSVSEASDSSSNPFSSESSTSTTASIFSVPASRQRPRASSVESSTEKARGEIDPNHFVFAQLGALHVFGGKYEDDKADDLSVIDEGPWWSNGFAVVVRISEKGVPGAVYVLYNHSRQTRSKANEGDDEFDHSPEAAGHIPGYLHPRCTEAFKFAKIADSIQALGDHKRRFSFIPLSQNEIPIVRARMWQSNTNFEVKEGKRVWDWYIAPTTGSWQEPIKPRGQPAPLQTTTNQFTNRPTGMPQDQGQAGRNMRGRRSDPHR